MKAVVLKSAGALSLMDVPEPPLPPGFAMVKMTHCGICGSDVRYLHGDNPWAKQTLGEKRENPTNIILGHEPSGVVEAVGEGVDRSLLGKRVALLAFGTCGVCEYCTRGEEQLCPDTQHLGHGAGWGESEYYYGGMAERVPILARWLVELPDTVDNESASVLDPLGVAVHGVGKTKVGLGDSLLVIGCGPVGVLASPVAKHNGAKFVAAVDFVDSALQVGRQLGADFTAKADRPELGPALLGANAGRPYRGILDTIGAPLDQYMPLLARGGTYVMMTVTENPQSFTTQWLAGERTLVSSCNFQFREYDVALDLLAKGIVKPGPMITHRFALKDAIEAFRIAENKDQSGAVKVLLTN